MANTATAWKLEVERGPGCLFVQLEPSPEALPTWDGLADHLWELLEGQFTYRIVLDMRDVEIMNSTLIGQLVMLHKRVHTHEGMLRLCHLSEANQQVLQGIRMLDRFPNYANREQAVMGHRPAYPR